MIIWLENESKVRYRIFQQRSATNDLKAVDAGRGTEPWICLPSLTLRPGHVDPPRAPPPMTGAAPEPKVEPRDEGDEPEFVELSTFDDWGPTKDRKLTSPSKAADPKEVMQRLRNVEQWARAGLRPRPPS